MSDLFNKGIPLANGFSLGAKSPLDTRDTQDTIADRDKLVTDNLAYEGMKVYVKDDKKLYILKDLDNNTWEEVGAGAGSNIPPTLNPDGSLSTKKGSILKVDNNGDLYWEEPLEITETEIDNLFLYGGPGIDDSLIIQDSDIDDLFT